MTAKAQAPTFSAFQDFVASVKITEPATPKRHRKPQVVAVDRCFDYTLLVILPKHARAPELRYSIAST